ncbi:lipoprotein [Escherichia coli]|uniref:Lipoprotein n=1 Tax=Escherichia coli TaxID=562 RepID=A0A377D3L2_ECOLX|nr:lipoprotein [Escherichia coli]
MIFAVTSGDYAIPVTNGSGAVGKALDIRPPAQPLALVSGARTQFTGDTASLLVENGRGNTLWPQVVSVLQAKNYTITQRDDAGQTLTTDWVQWNRLDEDEQYRGRYQISVKPQGYQQAVTVKLLNLEQAGKPVADAASMQRYSTEMMNVIPPVWINLPLTPRTLRKIVPPPLWTYKVQLMTPVYQCWSYAGRQCGLATSASGAGKSGHESDRQHPFAGQHGRNL